MARRTLNIPAFFSLTGQTAVRLWLNLRLVDDATHASVIGWESGQGLSTWERLMIDGASLQLDLPVTADISPAGTVYEITLEDDNRRRLADPWYVTIEAGVEALDLAALVSA